MRLTGRAVFRTEWPAALFTGHSLATFQKFVAAQADWRSCLKNYKDNMKKYSRYLPTYSLRNHNTTHTSGSLLLAIRSRDDSRLALKF